MKVKMTMKGDERLLAQLRYLADVVPDKSRKVMHRNAPKIVELAKMMAPEDDAELTDSIRIEKGYEDRGRLKVDIVVGGIVRGVDVDRYAMLIHENYESMTPGEITILKRQIHPDVYVGSKFLERAVEKFMPKFRAALIDVVYQEMRELEG